MVRWEPGAAGRLHTAALELFVEQGFAETTVPQIAARAGLTTRSFFRYFADKREVLFTGEEELPIAVAEVFARAAPELSPMQVAVTGLIEVVAPRFDGLRGYLVVRRGIIESDPGLRERELRKLSVLTEGGVAGFRARGLGELEALVAAQMAVTVFDVSISRWLMLEPEQPLAAVMEETARVMVELASAP